MQSHLMEMQCVAIEQSCQSKSTHVFKILASIDCYWLAWLLTFAWDKDDETISEQDNKTIG